VITATESGGSTKDTPTVTVIPKPQITFSADPTTIQPGDPVTLTWEVFHADSCVIEPDVGSVTASGSVTVNPIADTVYTLTASGPGGSTTSTTSVSVAAPIDIQILYPADGAMINRPLVLTKGHTWYQDRVVADLDHFLDWIFQPVGHKLSLNPFKYSFKNDDVPKGIVGFGIDLQAQIIAKVLEVVLGDDTGAVQVTSQLEGADNPWGRDPLHVQHLHVKLGVVSNDDVVFIVYQIFKFVVDPTSHKGWFVLDHLVGNVVDSHSINGDRLARVEQITDGRTIIWLEGYLAKPIVCSGSGCLCIEVDVHSSDPIVSGLF
jgi:hypothetical protein